MTDSTTEPAGTELADQDPLGDAGKRALTAERNARREAERHLREAEARVAEFERRDLVNEVASAKGIAPELAPRLKGDTREELEADADALLQVVAPEQGPQGGPGRRPAENLKGGTDPTAQEPDEVNKIAERILEQ
jgi:hypothetical protein